MKGDDNIMSEIYTRGPVSAYINADCIETYTGGINMYDTCNTHTTNHAIQLNGWGTENGVDYWIARNSWGTYWGKLRRFSEILFLETCVEVDTQVLISSAHDSCAVCC